MNNFKLLADYVDYIKTNLDRVQIHENYSTAEQFSDTILYYLFKNDQTFFFDMPTEFIPSINVVYLNKLSGGIYKILEREVVLIGTTENFELVVYYPGKTVLNILPIKYIDLFHPERLCGLTFVAGTSPEISLTIENRDFIYYVLHNKTVHQRWGIGKKMFESLPMWSDVEITCQDKKIPFIKSASNSIYFFTYFRQNNRFFKTNYEFLGPSYLLEDYLHFTMATAYKDFEIIEANVTEFLQFACYLQDYEYLYCLIRSLDIEDTLYMDAIYAYIGEILLIAPEQNILDFIETKYFEESKRLQEEFLQSLFETQPFDGSIQCLDTTIKVNRYLIAHKSPYLYDAIINQKKIECSSGYLIEYQKFVFRKAMDKSKIISNILNFLEFAVLIQDYQFMFELIDIFFTEPKTSFYARQDINQYLRDLQHKMKEEQKSKQQNKEEMSE